LTRFCWSGLHTKQALVDDLLDSVATFRTNRKAGLKGELRLRWDRDGRRWALHIAVPTGCSSDVSGGSRRWVKLDKARKRVQVAAASSLRNVDHQVCRKVPDLAVTRDTGTIVAGDVRGIERGTAQAERRRAGRHQRRRLSPWSRGRQERYLLEKTSGDVSHINEAYSSKTCPACLPRNRPAGRNYQCRACGFASHRGAVGAIKIAMRAIYGENRRIDPGAIVRSHICEQPHQGWT
jgi:hypothetical protein